MEDVVGVVDILSTLIHACTIINFSGALINISLRYREILYHTMKIYEHMLIKWKSEK